jgi:Phage-related minor tail protein
MAKKRINKSDVAPKGVFDNVTEGAKQAKIQIDLLTNSVKILQQNAKLIKKGIGGTSTTDTKGMRDFDALAQKANTTARAKLNIDKQLTHHKAKLSQLQRDENKAIRTTIEAQSKLNQKQKQSLGTLQKLERSNRQLRAERAKLNLETKKGVAQLTRINAKLDANNAKIRASGDAMKRQRMNVGNYTNSIGKLTSMLGRLGLGFGVFAALRSAFNTVKNFEQGNANLASVLGVTTEETKKLTEQQLKLGSTTTFTASQVSELQVEYAKLGFTQEQIHGMTESTLLLAEATGSELGESASVVGATMRGFGMDVSETQRVVDVMANSFSKSSLDMSKFSTSMSAVAPVAKLAGLNIEETTALLGTLTDRGIDASTAGTGLRNMFLSANKQGITFSQALNKVKNASDQTAMALELFGKRGATMGVILANNQEQVSDLTQELYASDDAARKMAETQRNTLGGSIKLLTSAWEGWILKQNEAGGASDKLREIIEYLSENIENILNWVMFAVKQFLIFKGVMIGMKVAMMAYNAVMIATKVAMGGFVKAMKTMDKGMKSSGIGLLVSLLIQLVYWIYEAVTAESELEKAERERREEVERLKKAEQEEQEQFDEGINGFLAMVEVLKKTNAGSRERAELIEKINKKYGTTIKNIKDEAKFMSALNVQVDAYIKLQVTRFKQAKNQKELTKQIGLQIEAEKKVAEITARLMKSQKKKGERDIDRGAASSGGHHGQILLEDETLGAIRQRLQIDGNLLTEWEGKLRSATEAMKKLGGEAVELTTTTFEADDIIVEDTGSTTEPEKEISLIRQIEDARIKLIEDAHERADLARAKQLERLIEDTEAKKTDATEFATWKKLQEKVFVQDIQKIHDKFEAKKKKVRQLSELAMIEAGITEKEIELEKISDIFENYEETEELRRAIDEKSIELIEKKAEFDVDNTELSEGEKRKIITDSILKIEEIEAEARARKKAHQDEERKRLQEDFTEAENEKYLELLRSSKDQEQIAEAMLDFQIKQLEELIALYKKLYPELTKEITEMEIELEEKRRERLQGEIKDTEDAEAEMARIRQQAIQSMTDYFIKMSDKRIAKLDEEIQAHQDLSDHLKDLAREGNITAKESLAEEQQLIAEAEQAKAEEEQRKQRVLLVSAFIKTYLAAIDEGKDPADAFTQALTSQALLEQVVNSLSGFFDGTENTGTASNPLDSNGGRLAILHNNERVMTAKQNAMMGAVSNEEVARVMENHRFGRLKDGNQIGVGWENIALLDQLTSVGDKLDAVNKTIENKPETNIKLGEITSKTMEIIETRKQGGTKTINTFKVKPQ